MNYSGTAAGSQGLTIEDRVLIGFSDKPTQNSKLAKFGMLYVLLSRVREAGKI
jgi:hypothetical protein